MIDSMPSAVPGRRSRAGDSVACRGRGPRRSTVVGETWGCRILLVVLAISLGLGSSFAMARASSAESPKSTSAKTTPVAKTPKSPSGPGNLAEDRLAALMSARAVAEPCEPNEIMPPEVEEEEEVPPEEELPSRIEMLLSGEGEDEVNDVSIKLKQFGYDVFGTPVTTFAPVTNVPVGPDYAIGPGDSFTLTLWGRVDAQYPVQVDRNGQIVLPEVGALRVWGMKFGEIESYLQHELSRKFTDFKMSVAMDRLRTIQVFIVGEVAAPGTYTVSSLSTAINALFAAGGPTKNGTLRTVRLSRNGQEPIRIDLYDLLLGGDRSKDVRLQDGDTIFIPVVGSVVGVAGNVKRPAIYEMAGPMTLDQVLDLAGGVAFSGWRKRVQVERVENHERRIVVDFDISQTAEGTPHPTEGATILQDGDVVKVLAVAARQERTIHLEGHVIRPGKYQWKSGMRLSDVLTSYDVIQPEPNTEYGEIERLVPPDLHPIVVPFNPGRMLAGDESQDLELAQYDTIRVFRWDERISQNVRVSGVVFDPNEYRLIPDMKVADLIDAAGGLQKNAYIRMAEITRRRITQEGMTTAKIDINLEKALAGDPEHNVQLQDYDHLVVRPIPDLLFDVNAVIEGEVRFPGEYPIRKGETLSSLIERAGGYTDEAYLRGAVFTRESAKDVQRRRMDDLILQIEESMLSSAQEQISASLDASAATIERAALETKKTLLQKLRAVEITGRVVVQLAALEEFKGSKYDMELENGDKLIVPQMPGVVHVVGEVFNPTSLVYDQRGTVSYYLNRVGGMTKEADKKQVSVIKADGTVISMAQGNRGKLLFWDSQHNSWFSGGFMSHRMEPGDTIVVPRKIDKYLQLRTVKDVTQIIFQIAVAAGVAFAI